MLWWIALLAISGCERVWFVEIVEVLPNLTPVFCVSEKEHCKGDAVGLGIFAISEVSSVETEEGPRDQYETVWCIQANRSAPLSRVTYGVTPDGWEASVPAVPLRLGAVYEVHSVRFSLYREAGGAIGWNRAVEASDSPVGLSPQASRPRSRPAHPSRSRCTMHAGNFEMRQRVTLTFDNGPTPVTARVLDVLGARGIRASFFLVGDRLRRPGARALVERAVAEGHRIGNHSLTHSTPLGVRDDPAEAAREIDEMQALLGDLVPGERFFRPFGGGGVIDRNLLGRRALERLVQGAYTCVLWNSVPRDWEDPAHWPDTCLADVAQRAWSVVVLHDLPTGAMDRLPAFLDALDARGIEVAHELPDDCVPLRRGRPTPAFETLTWIAAE